MNVVGYCRVSTDEQVTTGVSIEIQEERIRSYCKARDWELISVVKDEGISAKNLKRPGIQYILDMLPRKSSRGFDGIVVLKLDRLTRSVKDLAILNEEFKKYGIIFISIGESVDTSTATGELFHNIVASISQWERKVIGERTKIALQHKRRLGQLVGGVPYGYGLAKNKKTLEVNKAEQYILNWIHEMRLQRWSLQRIANYLNDNGTATKTGKKWYAETVRSVLEHSGFVAS